MTDRPLPTRWERFIRPEHDSTGAPWLKITALGLAVGALLDVIFREWLVGFLTVCWVGSTWMAARIAQFSYRAGYWQAYIDVGDSVKRAALDGLDTEEWAQRENDRLAAQSMQWHAGTRRRWRLGRRRG